MSDHFMNGFADELEKLAIGAGAAGGLVERSMEGMSQAWDRFSNSGKIVDALNLAGHSAAVPAFAGGIIGGGKALYDDKSAVQVAKNALMGAAIGGTLGAGIAGAAERISLPANAGDSTFLREATKLPVPRSRIGAIVGGTAGTALGLSSSDRGEEISSTARGAAAGAGIGALLGLL